MRMVYQSVILRDMVLADIEDEVLWQTQMLEWQFWDAPEESTVLLERADVAQERQRIMEEFKRLEQIREADSFRWSLEIDTIEGSHIGSIDSYWIEEGKIAIGISICRTSDWGKGYGTDALEAYLLYHQQCGRNEVFLETWSGNHRMVAVAQKLGFKEVRRDRKSVKVGEEMYDGLLLQKQFH